MYLQKVIIRKNCVKKLVFAGILKSITILAGSGSISQRHGSPDPDPPKNVMDPQHCLPGISYIPIRIFNPFLAKQRAASVVPLKLPCRGLYPLTLSKGLRDALLK
jgi:hypothetical protein